MLQPNLKIWDCDSIFGRAVSVVRGNDGGTEKLETSPDGSRCEKKRKVLFFLRAFSSLTLLNIKVTMVLEFVNSKM